jgi:adenosylmethionine-8-amino-7-oxononanoate aminotransferase
MTTLTLVEYKKSDLDYLWHPWTSIKEYSRTPQLIISEGKGCIVKDINGNEYFDARSGVLNASCGYSRREIIEAISNQLHQLMTFDLAGAATLPAILLAKKMAELMPNRLKRTLFCSSGSEATESAIKVARLYQRLKGNAKKTKIISLEEGYHGATLGAMSASHSYFTQYGYEPLADGFIAIPTPRCIQCSNSQRHSACEIPGPELLEQCIEKEGAETIAAFIMEPILGIGGVIIPPDNYLSEIRRICDKYGLLLILDEVLTGFGRTGKMFAMEHWAVEPDILLSSKGISGGYVPLSALTTTEEVFEQFIDDPLLEGLRHGHTNAGHATACAAALAVIRIIEQEGLIENARTVGSYLIDRLTEMSQQCFSIREIRGKGLLIAVELIDSPGISSFFRTALNNRLIVRQQGSVIILVPPLIITMDEAERLANIFNDTLKQIIT